MLQLMVHACSYTIKVLIDPCKIKFFVDTSIKFNIPENSNTYANCLNQGDFTRFKTDEEGSSQRTMRIYQSPSTHRRSKQPKNKEQSLTTIIGNLLCLFAI